ncbi:hypothetical protein ACQPZG_06215 [Streptomyces sp. CA-294286]|uniref:hypothetical protein n=1 Tax=Streptomyces sp. CA-294286 TaxID=3240070 RepID=UPI003D933D38
MTKLDENKIPVGPLGMSGAFRVPSELKLGDVVHLHGGFYPIEDMGQGRGGARVLHLRGREPYYVSDPVLAYRQINFEGLMGYRLLPTVSRS